jgi:predicted transposase/invertase (TIGR01784 family)
VRNDKHPEISYDMLQMTFVILPRFTKTESECKTAMDKVLFALKNGHKLKGIPKSFREKPIRQIFEVAEISNFTSRELYRYEAIMMNKYDQRACLAYAKEEGEKKGFVDGMLKAAKSMLADGLDPARVARITKLPKKQVMALR